MCMACVLSMLVQYYCSELPFPVIEGIYLVGSCVQSFTKLHCGISILDSLCAKLLRSSVHGLSSVWLF